MFMAGDGTVALAGPFIFAGTDADDHGSTSAGANQDGWFFMQRSLENMAPAVTNGNHSIVVLGSTSTAGAAASSAFTLSTLAGAGGWTLQTVSVAGFTDFFNGTAVFNVNNAGILMMDSGTNVSGGVDGTSYTSQASIINTFLGAGGGLFSQANGYQWLTASGLLPGVTVPDQFDQGISLTAAGQTAFPGLTNADLSAGPYHQRFENFGALSVLGTANSNGAAIIIGSSGGSITNPGNSVPEPGMALLLGAGLVLFGVWRKALA